MVQKSELTILNVLYATLKYRFMLQFQAVIICIICPDYILGRNVRSDIMEHVIMIIMVHSGGVQVLF